MATLAPFTPVALVAPIDVLCFGTGAAAFNGDDLHGRDFKSLRRFMLGELTRARELAQQFVGPPADDNLPYNPVPPKRRTFATLVFQHRGRGLPVPYDLQED
jgi:hypothetical protein